MLFSKTNFKLIYKVAAITLTDEWPELISKHLVKQISKSSQTQSF